MNDTQAGIRPINVLRKLPVVELTDEEICKVFFERFDATALVMCYQDKDEQCHTFGRISRRRNMFTRYKMLLRYMRINEYYLLHDLKQFFP